MNKNDLEIRKLELKNERLEIIFGFVKSIGVGVVVLAGWWLFWWGLRPFLEEKPDQLSGLANVIKSVNFSNSFSYVLCAILSAGWYAERRGKKRAIRQKSHYQHLAEAGDPNRSSSGLTETGDSPQ